MKNLTKIFMAVAVAMFAFSCVNDTTEDIAVKVGGKTTLEISLGGGNRTTLGEAADGVYPITWAEGDQITVNGETSEPLAAADADTANAVFTFNAELSAPYCVAYPAAEANQVVFAAEQEYVYGTFANGAATMYGYATNGNITLNHLTGVLKIGVVCGEDVDLFDAPVLQSVKISTIDRAPIAGAFNINFETGAVTATDDAVSVINYTLDEKLSQNPIYLHVAVPAGVYNELYVTLEDSNGGVMYKTVTAGDNEPLAAGNVREFSSDIVYEATTTTDKHIIKDYASLLAFKGAVEGGSQLDAVFVGDVDLNGVNWGSIDKAAYKGTIYGNGFAIKGLDAPLFTNTGASFKGLHLVVNINETASTKVGAFATTAKTTAATAISTFENCTVSGAITVEYSGTHSDNGMGKSNIAAFAGQAYGVVFRNCTNSASITVKSLNKGTTWTYPLTGGIAGYANIVTFDETNYSTAFYNCTNNGAIELHTSTTTRHKHVCGGIFAGCAGASQITIENCCNNGHIKVVHDADGKNSAGAVIGGIVGYSTGNTKEFNFVGNITNNGTIELEGNYTVQNTAPQMVAAGGIVGAVDQVKLNFDDAVVENNSKITFRGTTDKDKPVYIGGILGYASGEAETNSSNIITPSITYYNRVTNNGEIEITADAKIVANTKVGGLFGYCTKAVGKLGAEGTHLTNNADITIEATQLANLHIGGITAHDDNTNIPGTGKGLYINKGNISNSCNVTGDYYVGGLFGQRKGTMSGSNKYWINTGNINLTGTFDSGKEVYVGGIVGKMATDKSYQRSQCYCVITAENYPKIGMLAGHNITGQYYQYHLIGGSINGTPITDDNKLEMANPGNTKTSGVALLNSANDIQYVCSDTIFN